MRHSSRAIAASNTQYASWVQEKFPDPNAPKPKPRVESVGLALLKTRISFEFLSLSDEEQVRHIKDAACAVYGLPPDTLDRKPKPGEVIRAKQIALYLCDQTTTLTYLELGHFFSYRDPGAVGHKIRQAKEILANPDEGTVNALVEICARLESAA